MCLHVRTMFLWHMYDFMCSCINVCTSVSPYVCMYVYMYVCMCIPVCMYV